MTNQSKPLISTVLLNWNRADLLQRTLTSYLDTIACPFELFVVDNGSTDGSPAVIKDFCDAVPEIHSIFLATNCGGEALNNGLQQWSATMSWNTVASERKRYRVSTWLV